MNKPLLKHYAEALFSLGKEEGKTDLYQKGLVFAADVFNKNPESLKFFSSPMIEKAEKEKLLDECFKDNVDIAVLGFLKVLIKRKAIRYIDTINQEYLHLIHIQEGILEGRIYTPYPLSENTLHQLEDEFSKKYQKKVIFRILIDHRMLAGMKIYVNDTLYDYSLDTKLNRVRDNLLYRK